MMVAVGRAFNNSEKSLIVQLRNFIEMCDLEGKGHRHFGIKFKYVRSWQYFIIIINRIKCSKIYINIIKFLGYSKIELKKLKIKYKCFEKLDRTGCDLKKIEFFDVIFYVN